MSNTQYLHQTKKKDLGIIVDNQLEFETHIMQKAKKASCIFVMIRTIKNLDPNTFKPLYTSLVRSHLEYGTAIWSPNKSKHIETLE